MTVTTTTSSTGPLYGDGVQTIFPFTFQAASADEVAAYIDGVRVDGFTVNLQSDNTGGVVFAAAPSPGAAIYLLSAPAFVNRADFQRFGPYFPDELNPHLDHAVIRDIALKGHLDRALISPPGVDPIAYFSKFGFLPGPRGSAGPAGPTFLSLLDFKAAAIANERQALKAPGIPFGDFNWTPGDYSNQADNVNVIKADSTALSVGAWVRQIADGVSFKQSGEGAVLRSAGSKSRESLSPEDFGAVAGATASANENTLAFRRAIDEAVRRNATLSLRGNLYRLDASGQPTGGVNFAEQGLVIKGGGATLMYVGPGRAFQLDSANGIGGFLEEMCVDDLLIVGNPAVTDGFYNRGIVRSVFRNIEVRDVSQKAFNILHGVSNHYDSLRYSPRPLNASVDPASVHAQHGLYLDANGDGYYTANCVFTNPVMEDFSGIGCEMADASGCLVSGGTFEACATGLIVGAKCRDNTIAKNWLEGNTSTDAVIYGSGTGLWGNRFLSPSSNLNVQVEASAKGTWFAGGGYIRAVSIAPGATGTSFHQVGVDENLSGTIGFQGSGPYTRIACTKIGNDGRATGTYSDLLGPAGSWSPQLAAGSGTITMNAGLTQGTYQRVGNVVFAQCFVYVDSVSGPAGALTIGGLPFVSQARQPISIQVSQLVATFNAPAQGRVDGGSASISLTKISNGLAVDMASDVKADSTFSVSLTYMAQT